MLRAAILPLKGSSDYILFFYFYEPLREKILVTSCYAQYRIFQRIVKEGVYFDNNTV